MNKNLKIKIERPLGIQHLGNPLGQKLYRLPYVLFQAIYKKRRDNEICFMKFFTVR